MSYHDKKLTTLAQTNPKELARILSGPTNDTGMLTFGVEILGEEVKDETIVLPVIRRLLRHINAVVREGAILGAASFYSNNKPPQDIVDRLRVMSNSDPSPSIRSCASDILDTWSEHH